MIWLKVIYAFGSSEFVLCSDEEEASRISWLEAEADTRVIEVPVEKVPRERVEELLIGTEKCVQEWQVKADYLRAALNAGTKF